MEQLRKMHISKKVLMRFQFTIVLVGALFISIVLYETVIKLFPFFTTSSPADTYTVNLSGRKERPFIFGTHEVRFDVLKNKKSFVYDQYLHSGDFMDTSFEEKYNQHKWIDENILRFYNENYSNKINPDAIIVINQTKEVIKYLKIFSGDKFLLFDLPPISKTKLLVPLPGGDFREIYVQGEYSKGLIFEKGESISLVKGENLPQTYIIYINGADLTIEKAKP
jgi:hypothetical protein